MATIGIDLGTTNTVIAAVVKDMAMTLEDERGFRLLPSIVSFDPGGDVLVGFNAKDRRVTDPENTIYSVKRLIGRAWNSADVVQARTRFPFKLVEGPKRTVNVVARAQQYAMPEISAFVLRRARQMAERVLGESVDSAVITVPANFNDLQRASTKVAGRLAGLEVLRILNEPTAAALAYGQTQTESERIAVFDLGGGTFDITILDLSGDIFEVLTTSGDTALGGDDVDVALADYLSDVVKKNTRKDPRDDPHAFGTLCIVAEYIKTQLSQHTETEFEIRDLSPKMRLSLPITVTRGELERIATPFVDRTLAVTRNCLIACNLVPRDIDRVIMVGGSTRMPLVVQKVGEFFNKAPDVRVNPDEVVALGASIQAHALSHAKKGVRGTMPGIAPNRTAVAIPTPSTGGGASRPPPAPGMPRPDAVGERTVQMRSPVHVTDPVPPTFASPPEQEPMLLELAKASPRISWGPPEAQVEHAPSNPPAEAAVPDFDLPSTPYDAPPPISFPDFGPPGSSANMPLVGFTGDETVAHAGGVPDAAFGDFGGPDFAQPVPTPHHMKAARPADAFSSSAMAGASVARGLPVDEGAGSIGNFSAAMLFDQAQANPEHAIRTRGNAPLLVDVTPLSLRVETAGGYSDVLVAAGTPIPCDKTRSFMTARDGQTTVVIRVAQGEHMKFADNTALGDLELTDIPAAARGELEIMVTFELDADGILNVKAREKRTNKQAIATMKLLGANTDAEDVATMAVRQSEYVVR